jgi:hypothetical protein
MKADLAFLVLAVAAVVGAAAQARRGKRPPI